MNVLQILPELNVGGVETGTIDLAWHLLKLGHKAVVVSNGGELVNKLKSFGAIHYQLPVHKKSLFTIIRMIPILANIINKEDIDIVHARSRVPAWIAYFAARKTKTIFITTAHGYYQKHFFSSVMGWGKKVIVVSNAIARHMIEDFGVPHEKIKLIPRGVDLEKFKYSPSDKVRDKEFIVGIIGRLSPIKGHLYFFEAMARASRSIPNLKIWVIGDASGKHQSYKEEIQILVRRLGLWHSTEFLGVQRDVPKVLSKLDLLVLATTTHEAFGKVIIEAQASGVPVVATEVGGIVDVVEHEKTGLLVTPTDPKGMAEAVIRIYRNPKFGYRLAENAYKNVKKKYNLDLLVKNTLDVYNQALNSFKILIIKFSSLGDIILSTAAIRAIRKKFPKNYSECSGSLKNSFRIPKRKSYSLSRYKISFLVGEEFKDVLLRCPYIDELLVVGIKNKGVRQMLKLSEMLRKKNFDIVLDLQNNRRSHILSFLTSSPNRYGYDNKKFSFLLNYRTRFEKQPIDPVAHQFKILENLGIDLKDPYLELWLGDEDRHYIDKLLSSYWISKNQKIIGINVSASQRWSSKNWPLKYIIKLCEELGKRKMRVVLTGTEKDLPQANSITQEAYGAKIINACAKTSINQLACLINRCNVFVSGDSSALHIAAAVNTPFVALFGPTDPKRHLPPAKKYIVIKKDLSCSPCYRSKCTNMKCMEFITVEEVLQAVNQLI